MSLLRSVVAFATLVAFAHPVLAQEISPRPALSFSAGAFQYDLSGTGTAPMLAGRAEYPLGRFFIAEGGLSAARPSQQFGSTTTFLASELQLQTQARLAHGRIAPYLGLGGGMAIDQRTAAQRGTRHGLTLSGATGARYWLSDAFGLRGELRVRGIGRNFGGSAAEWTVGTAWRL